MHPYGKYKYIAHFSRFNRGGLGRFCKRSMLGRFFVFAVGVYAGIVANQHYEIPPAPTPTDAWEKVKGLAKDQKKTMSADDQEKVDDIMDTLKKIEKKYRKDQSKSQD